MLLAHNMIPKTITAKTTAAGLKIGIVVSRFNEEITRGLLLGAISALDERGANENDVMVVEVPGAFEIPLALDWLASNKYFDVLIALGAVIEGETKHFDYISEAAMRGIQTVSLKYAMPIACGVLTTYTDEQATARSIANEHNKGMEAALAAIEMANLKRQLS